MATCTTSKKSTAGKKVRKTSAKKAQKQAQKQAQLLWNKREWKRLQWQRHSFHGWLGTLGVQLQDEDDTPNARQRLFPFIEEGDVAMADGRGVAVFGRDGKEKPNMTEKEEKTARTAEQASPKTQNKLAKADKQPRQQLPAKNEENEEPSDSSTKSSSPSIKPAVVKGECASKKQPVIVLSEEAGDAEEAELFAEIREKLNYPESKSREQFRNDLKSSEKLRARFGKLLAERGGAAMAGSEPKQTAEKEAQKAKVETPTGKSAVCDEDARRKRGIALPVVSWHKDLAKLETYDYTGPVVNYKGFEKEIIAA